MDPATLAAMGSELRARRRARELTRAALAEAVGTRPVILGRWERGEAVPTAEQAQGLAEVLDLPSGVAADWAALAEQAGGGAGEGPGRGWRLPGRRAAGGRPAPADQSAPGAPPASPRVAAYHSYLDDPAEQRRYILRWALTLVILGALAVWLIWALGELAEGWRGLVELFRTVPPSGDPAGAFGLVGAV